MPTELFVDNICFFAMGTNLYSTFGSIYIFLNLEIYFIYFFKICDKLVSFIMTVISHMEDKSYQLPNCPIIHKYACIFAYVEYENMSDI